MYYKLTYKKEDFNFREKILNCNNDTLYLHRCSKIFNFEKIVRTLQNMNKIESAQLGNPF